MKDVVVLVPMLGRAHLMATVRDSLHDTTDRARLVWLVTSGDWNVITQISRDESYQVSPPRPRGDYAAKVNAGVVASTEPLIFLGAVDIRFHPGWLDACLPHVAAGAGVVGTNDLGNKRTATGSLSTHTLVTREYAALGTIDEPGKLLHEGYWHEYVDDEFIATARHRGRYAHAPDAVVEHLHPAWGKAPSDPMYEQARIRMAHGQRLYRRRRRLWRG